MRHIILLGAMLLAAGQSTAQSPELTIHLGNGENVTIPHDQIRNIRFSGITDVVGPEPEPSFILRPAWPNPFNPTTTLEYVLPRRADVSVSIVDLRGARVAQLAGSVQDAGVHRLEWNGLCDNGLPAASGLYLCTVRSEGQCRTHKLILMK